MAVVAYLALIEAFIVARRRLADLLALNLNLADPSPAAAANVVRDLDELKDVLLSFISIISSRAISPNDLHSASTP